MRRWRGCRCPIDPGSSPHAYSLTHVVGLRAILGIQQPYTHYEFIGMRSSPLGRVISGYITQISAIRHTHRDRSIGVRQVSMWRARCAHECHQHLRVAKCCLSACMRLFAYRRHVRSVADHVLLSRGSQRSIGGLKPSRSERKGKCPCLRATPHRSPCRALHWRMYSCDGSRFPEAGREEGPIWGVGRVEAGAAEAGRVA